MVHGLNHSGAGRVAGEYGGGPQRHPGHREPTVPVPCHAADWVIAVPTRAQQTTHVRAPLWHPCPRSLHCVTHAPVRGSVGLLTSACTPTMRQGLALLLVTASLTQPVVAQRDADRRAVQEIRALFEQFNAAWERRDTAFIGRYYAHDSTGMFFFERRQLMGWPRVDTLYRNMFASAARGRVRSLFDVLDVGARGNVGWLAANFRLEVIEATGDTTVDEGRQSLVFERRAGRWMVVHRHTSFQAPPGPQRRAPLHVTPGPLWSPVDDTTGGPDARAVRQRREASNRAIAQHDSAAFAATLAAHVIVVSSNSTRSDGRDAYVARMVSQFRARPDVVYRRTPIDVRLYLPWGMASEHGTWTGSWTEPDGRVTIGGTFFAKWRKVGDAWMIESEVFVPERCSGSIYCQRAP
jgi:ketosteroid isomerase-like protein